MVQSIYANPFNAVGCLNDYANSLIALDGTIYQGKTMTEYVRKPLPDTVSDVDTHKYAGWHLNKHLVNGYLCNEQHSDDYVRRCYMDETAPRFTVLPTSVMDILNSLGSRYGVNEDAPFLQCKDDKKDAFFNAMRHIIPLSYGTRTKDDGTDVEGWQKSPSCAFSKRGKVQNDRKYLYPASKWQERLAVYNNSSFMDETGGQALLSKFREEAKSYIQHTRPVSQEDRRKSYLSRPSQWSYGFLMGEGFVAIDCDCEDDKESAQLLTLFLRYFPGSPIRSRGGSRWASILFVVDELTPTKETYKKWTVTLSKKETEVWTGETAEQKPPIVEMPPDGDPYAGCAWLVDTDTCKKTKCTWSDAHKPTDAKAKKDQLEIFGFGRQLAIQGWHTSGSPYTWYGGDYMSIRPCAKTKLYEFVSIINAHYGDGEEINEKANDANVAAEPLEQWDGETMTFFVGKDKRFFEYLRAFKKGNIQDAVRDSEYFITEDAEKIYITCPNEEAHSSDTGIKQTCLFKDSNVFHCFHASCKELNQKYFAQFFPHGGTDNVVVQLYEMNCLAITTPKKEDDEPYVSEVLAKTATYSIMLRDSEFSGLELRHDDFTNADMYRIIRRKCRCAFQGYPDEGRVTDEVTTEIANLLSYLGVKKEVKARQLREVIHAICNANRYDSAIESVNSLPEWDGVERIPNFFDRYMENVTERTDDDRDWMSRCSKYLFTSLMGRMLCGGDDGVQADISLVLQGAQGQRKSTFVKILAGSNDRFGQYDFSLSSAERARSCVGKTVMEIPELIGMSRRDANEVKSALTKTFDKYRKLFSEDEITSVRRCIFVFTTNDSTFLNDATGDRRFAVVNLGWNHETLVHERIEEDYPQLMAEAKKLYEENGIMWRDVAEKTDEKNASAREIDPWQTFFEEKLTGVMWATVDWMKRLVTIDLRIDMKDLSEANWRRACKCIRCAGMFQKQIRVNDKVKYFFVRRDTKNEVVKQDMERGRDVGTFNGYIVTDADEVISQTNPPSFIPKPIDIATEDSFTM